MRKVFTCTVGLEREQGRHSGLALIPRPEKKKKCFSREIVICSEFYTAGLVGFITLCSQVVNWVSCLYKNIFP